MSKIPAFLMAAIALAATAPSPGQDALVNKSVPQLVATLKSDAPHEQKADACRQLGLVGTKETVPVLAALLGDEKLAHMARYALEPMPDPAVDEAFRAALGNLKGRPLVGVICSIGVRHDVKATALLAKRLQDADTDVAQAAARALGRLGTAEAAKALQGALSAAPAANRLAVCEGLFRCAAALAAQGRRDQALAIYDRLRGLPGPHQVRAGALAAAILTRQKDGLPLLVESLRSRDYTLFAAAVRAAQQLPGPEVTAALIDALSQLSDDRQIAIILALGKRGDSAAVPAIAARARTASKPVRLAAVRTLAELNQATVLPVLLGLLGQADEELAKAALDGMAGLSGREVDAAVVAMFATRDNRKRLTALELIGRRRITAATAALLKAAGEADPQIRSAAVRRLGELGGPAELPPLLDMLVRRNASQDLGTLEEAIGGLLSRLERPESYADQLASLLAQAQPGPKGALLRILGLIGGAKALKAVRAAVDDPNGEVQAAAIRALGAWKTAGVVPELLAVARSAGNPNHKTLALRAYLGWASRPDLPADQRMAICRQAAQLAERVDQKRLLLSALSSVDSPEALAAIVPYLAAAETRAEAAAAAVSAAERLLKQPNAPAIAAQLVEPLRKVTEAAVPPHLAQRAKAALRLAQSKMQKK